MAERRELDADLQWAAEHAPRLVAEARAEALEEARARLRARLVDALLESAEAAAPQRDASAQLDARRTKAPARGAGAPDTAERAAPRAAVGRAAEPSVGLWLYGVLPGDVERAPALSGVDGRHRVELLRHEGLAALVSAVPLDAFGEHTLRESLEDIARLESLARGHEHVLDQALRLGPLVPFRLCTIYEHADTLREMLHREREPLAAALQRLAGMAEWGVKAFLVVQDAERAGATVDSPASGTDYLSRKRQDREAAETAREAVDDAVERIHARLSEQAAAAAVSRPHDRRLSGRDDEMVLNAAYLVPNACTAEFQALVDEIADHDAPAGLTLERTGPWPAYHFVAAGDEP
jgi:hypothetical protein